MRGGTDVRCSSRCTSKRDIFAANRATGRSRSPWRRSAGGTRRARVHEDGSLRVRFPNAAGDGARSRDRQYRRRHGRRRPLRHRHRRSGAGAGLVAGTAAAEKIYRSHRAGGRVDVKLDVGAGARLAWLPQETILFDRARLSRRIDVDLAEGASLLLAEAVVFGRAAMGETMRQGHFADRWRLRRGGRLIFADSARLDGDIATSSPAGGRRRRHRLATVLVAPADEATIAAVRALDIRRRGRHLRLERHRCRAARARSDGALAPRSDRRLATLGQPVPRLWLQLRASNEPDAAREGQAADRHGRHGGAPPARARRQAQPSRRRWR